MAYFKKKYYYLLINSNKFEDDRGIQNHLCHHIKWNQKNQSGD